MYDVITIGSATLDIAVKSPEFTLAPLEQGGVALCQKLGGKMDVEAFKMVSGGGATNVAVGCARLGLRVAAVCEVGQDFPAHMISDELQKEGVDTQFMIAERLEDTAVSVLLVAANGGRTIMTHRGAAYQLESRDIPWDHLHRTRWIHLGTLGGEKAILFDVFEFLQHKEIGCSWTPSPKDLDVFLHGQLDPESIRCDVLLLNKEEWEHIAKVHEVFLRVIPMIVITDGKQGGVVLVDGVEVIRYQADKITSIEETGAGDAFTSGFISALLVGKSVPECVEWGKKNASHVIQFMGGKEGLLTKEKMEKA